MSENPMKYQLVLQWSGSSLEDYKRMIEVEEALIASIEEGEVDGHDCGQGEVNIFIFTDNPSKSFDEVKPVLMKMGEWEGVRVGYRSFEEENYRTLWPKGISKFEVL
jgi:hypothetical protein